MKKYIPLLLVLAGIYTALFIILHGLGSKMYNYIALAVSALFNIASIIYTTRK